MVTTSRTVLAFFFLSFFLLAVAEPSASAAALPFSGLVVDEQGEPVTGAEIQIYPFEPAKVARPGETITVHSGADGVFRIDGLQGGTLYRMLTWKPGFAPREDEDLDPAAGAVGSYRVVLRRGRTATGQLVDTAGQALADAVLELVDRSGRSGALQAGGSPLEMRLRQVRTGADGGFTVSDLTAGGYELKVSWQRLAPQRIALELPPGEGVWDFGRIEIGGTTLAGKVTDPSGRAVGKAVVWLLQEGHPDNGSWGQAPIAGTREDGTFDISGLPTYDEVALDICAEGFLPEKVVLRDVGTEILPVVLQPAGRITGRIVDSDGAPVAGVRVYSLRDGQSTGCEVHARPCAWDEDPGVSDADGRYVLTPLLATAYTIRVRTRGYLPDDRSVALGPGQVVEGLDFKLERGETLFGQVLGPDGEPVAGAQISASWSEEVTGEDGRYRITGLFPGECAVEVWAEGFEWAEMTTAIAAGENRLDPVLEPVSSKAKPVLREVRGRVVGLAGQPIVGARVSAERVHTVTDAEGAFSLRLPDGQPHDISAEMAGLRSSSEEVELGSEGVEGVEIRLLPEAVITGRVLGLEPGELAGLRVGIFWAGSFYKLATVGADGTYRIPHLGDGDWQVRAETAGRRAEAEVSIEEGQQEAVLDLHFAPVREVRGRVTDAAGRPVARAEVQFRTGSKEPTATSTRSDGSYRIRLEDGIYEIGVAYHSVRDDPKMKRVEIRGAPVDGLALVAEEW